MESERQSEAAKGRQPALNGKPAPQNADREEWLRNLRWRLADQRRWKRRLPAVAVILALTVIGAITASSDLTPGALRRRTSFHSRCRQPGRGVARVSESKSCGEGNG